MSEKFADPAVDERTVRVVENTAQSEGPVKPWTLLNVVAEKGVEKSEARKALRKLKLTHRIVPAGDFTGEIRLVEE